MIGLLRYAFACVALCGVAGGVIPNRSIEVQTSDLVTWDQHSVIVRGERIMFYSGEIHPFRLPSPGSWIDVFQKIKAAGFTGVSFYLMWGLLEGEPGHVRTDGIFALQDFFRAASDTGLYLLARPGPYINAEVSGGGFPGWVQRVSGEIRSNNPNFTEIVKPYLSHVGRLISNAQITNGGPVILVQTENEYSICVNYTSPGAITACLQPSYMESIKSTLREVGITVPLISNDAAPLGNWAPGSGVGEVDVYGMDVYPLDWSSGCMDPGNWTRGHFSLENINYSLHETLSPSNPFSIPEAQAGAADFWGGVGVDICAEMVNHKFVRVFNKFLYSIRVTVLNLYMMFGGTNWGNLGHPKGYTSYDVGAPISEDRLLGREKYYELKLQGYFLQSSPSYLTSVPESDAIGEYTNTNDVFVNRLKSQDTNYYIIRHHKYDSLVSKSYSLTISTKLGRFKIPQLGGSLSLDGRDSRILVSDYAIGNITLTYSSAEVLAWRTFSSKTVLLLYGGDRETHEFAFPRWLGCPALVEGPPVICQLTESLVIIQTVIGLERGILRFRCNLDVHLLERGDTYRYWVIDLPAPAPVGHFTSPSRLASPDLSVIVRGGYLIRSAKIDSASLYLSGDVNSTTEIEVVGAPIIPRHVFFNGEAVQISTGKAGMTATVQYISPNISLPDLSELPWNRIDSLPEIRPHYDDEMWTICNKPSTNNTRPLATPTSLYAGDYGYHSGSLLYRGYFTSTGTESSLSILTQGGDGFGHSVWLNSTFLGSWAGSTGLASRNHTLNFSEQLKPGQQYVITVLIDHMGLRDNWEADGQGMKEPRGILDYKLHGSAERIDISWKMIGNIGGESYLDHSRGPLNEGAMFAERNGFHLPGAPFKSWKHGTPFEGTDRPGVYMFDKLNTEVGANVPNFRVQIFMNGWQLGKYISNLGPQSRYVLPEGILNHHGVNYLALTVWSLDGTGSKIKGLTLTADAFLQSGKNPVPLVVGSRFDERSNSITGTRSN
ncbi:hypothetical protein V2G26_009450 [Clonostachys chloroleuca]